jgi:integrase
MHITEITVRNLRPPERGQVTYTDDSLTGFGVRVSQGGTKTFTLVYGEDRRRASIGRFPIISLADARAEAKRLLAEHTLGRKRPKSIRFDEALAEYFADFEERIAAGENKARTLSDYKRLINRYFNFGRTRLSEITHENVTAKLPKAPAERNHAVVAIKIFFSWAQKPPRRYIPHNPCEGMTPSKRASRKRLINDREFAAILSTALKGSDHYSRIVALLALTGQRRGEIVALQRPWIDETARTITLPYWLTKNKVEHCFPFGDMTAAVLQTIHHMSGTDYLFPATREHVRGQPTTTFNGFQKAKIEFDEVCGVTGWTLHDLRRKFSTTLAELRVPPHVVERLLNHKMGSISNRTDNGVTEIAEIYNRATYFPEMREAIALWETHVAKLRASRESSKVAQATA